MTTVKQIIEQLKDYPEDTEVIAFDPEFMTAAPVTGYLYDPEKKTLEICTDDQEG